MKSTSAQKALPFLVLLLFAILFPAHGVPGAKRVLLIHSYHPGYSFTEEEHRGIENAFRDEGIKVELYAHYLDTKRFDFTRRAGEMARHLSALYGSEAFDLVMVTDNDALNFALRYRSALFPNTPVVFCGVNDYSPDLLGEEEGITGVAEVVDFKGTIDSALSLFPDRDHLVFIIDRTATGTAVAREIARLQKSYPPSLTFIYLWMGRLSFAEIKELLKTYQGRSIVFPLQLNQDRDGRVYTVEEALEEVRASTSDPLFTLANPHYKFGVVGGKITLPYHQGYGAGKIASRILRGESPTQIPVQTETPSTFVFDYRYLKEYNIPLSALPLDSEILFQPPSVWDQYSETIPYILLLLVAETVLVLLLIHALRQNKQFQTMLQRLLKEKEMLAREVNHRVKNNLATVKSLLSIQKSSSSDPEVLHALSEAENRIQSISLTHQLLYGSLDSKTIDTRTYLEELIRGIQDSFQTGTRGVEIQLDVPEVKLEADMIRNIGLIVNEALTNALKHAFNGGGGTVRITLSQELIEVSTGAVSKPGKTRWVLTTEDDGKGIPQDKPIPTDSLGFILMESLAENLKGALTVSPAYPEKDHPGTRLTVVFPAS